MKADPDHVEVFERIADAAMGNIANKAKLVRDSSWDGRVWILGRIMFLDCVDNARAHGMIRIGFEIINSYCTKVTARAFNAREPDLIVFKVPRWTLWFNPEKRLLRKDRRLILGHYIGIKRERDVYVYLMGLKGSITKDVTIVGCSFSKRKVDVSLGVDLWIRCYVCAPGSRQEVRVSVDVKGPKHMLSSSKRLKANLIICDERKNPLSGEIFEIGDDAIKLIASAAREKAKRVWVNQKYIQSQKK